MNRRPPQGAISEAPISPNDFRRALSRFGSGVTIVTMHTGQRAHGLTNSAFTSVSAEPPLVAVIIDSGHTAHDILAGRDASFAVNILEQGQAALADRFARLKDDDRFAVGAWTTAVTGAPVLADAVAWLDCVVHDRVRAGTHTVFFGEVRASGVPALDAAPLVYWNRGYRSIESPRPQSPAGPAARRRPAAGRCQ